MFSSIFAPIAPAAAPAMAPILPPPILCPPDHARSFVHGVDHTHVPEPDRTGPEARSSYRRHGYHTPGSAGGSAGVVRTGQRAGKLHPPVVGMAAQAGATGTATARSRAAAAGAGGRAADTAGAWGKESRHSLVAGGRVDSETGTGIGDTAAGSGNVIWRKREQGTKGDGQGERGGERLAGCEGYPPWPGGPWL